MNRLFKTLLALTLSAAGLATATVSMAAPLKVGVSAVTAPSLEVAAQEARKQGIDVQVVEFSDWTTPNEALAAGDLDANFFQHIPFLNNAVKNRGYRFKVVDVGLLTNVGLFSQKYKSLNEVPPGATVSVYDDVTNQGRHLIFLQKLGLIRLKQPDNAFSSINDIAENPKRLKFVEIPGPQLARALADVDLAVGAPLFFVAAGQQSIASGGLAYSGSEDAQYAIHFITRASDPVDPRLTKLISIYQQSDVVRKQLHDSNGKDSRLYTLPWLTNTTAKSTSKP